MGQTLRRGYFRVTLSRSKIFARFARFLAAAVGWQTRDNMPAVLANKGNRVTVVAVLLAGANVHRRKAPNPKPKRRCMSLHKAPHSSSPTRSYSKPTLNPEPYAFGLSTGTPKSRFRVKGLEFKLPVSQIFHGTKLLYPETLNANPPKSLNPKVLKV